MSHQRHHQASKKSITLLSFYKRKDDKSESGETSTFIPDVSKLDEDERRPTKVQVVEIEGVQPSSRVQRVVVEHSSKAQEVAHMEVDVTSSFECDPGKRIAIYEYPLNKHDEVRVAYLRMGPCRPTHEKEKDYPVTIFGKQGRRFNANWYKLFPWLEYSLHKDRAYCFYCFLFETNPPKHPVFTIDGFQNWKRVNNGKKCPFLKHEGGLCSPHRSATMYCENLMNPSRHIDSVFNTLSKEAIANNRLLLRNVIQCIRMLALQGFPFRGHDESKKSKNCGNFIAMFEFSKMLNKKVAEIVGDCSGNAKYTSHGIQKTLLHIFAENVRKKIREDVGDAKFCILVDEAQDNSHREQMAIILRFVDRGGFVREM